MRLALPFLVEAGRAASRSHQVLCSSAPTPPPAAAAAVAMFASAPARRKSLKPSPLPSRARAMSTQVVDVSEFVPLRTLGQGSFGAVLLVRKRSAPNAGRAFAMKIMDKEKMIRRNITESARVEKEILRSARHPCLARLRYAFQSPARLFLVMDYYQGGSLEDRLRAEPGRAIAAAGATFAAGELALGLAHLHQLGVIHRDLKPANVLLDLGGHCAIADYGLAVALDTQADGARKRSFVGTLRGNQLCNPTST